MQQLMPFVKYLGNIFKLIHYKERSLFQWLFYLGFIFPISNNKRNKNSEYNAPKFIFSFIILISISVGAQPFFGPHIDYSTPIGSYAGGKAIGDIDGDGKNDLVIANKNSPGTISIFINSGNGTFGGGVEYSTDNSPISLRLADLNGDNKLDLVTANNYSTGTFSVLINNGDGTFASKVDYAGVSGGSPEDVAIGDFNADGKTDFAGVYYGNTSFSIFINTGSGNFNAGVTYPKNGTFSTSIAIADLNGDSKDDLAISNYVGDSFLTVFTNTGTGMFTSHSNYTTGTLTQKIRLDDLNGDNKLDIVITNDFPSGVVSVLLNNGNGTFASKVDYITGSSPSGLATGDINGDGKSDLIVANLSTTGTISLFINNGNGTFASKLDYPTDANPANVEIGDLNGDGKLDLAVSNQYSNAFNILFNITAFNPSITFTGFSYLTNNQIDLRSRYTSESLATVNFISSNPAVASISGTFLVPLTPGIVSITGTQGTISGFAASTSTILVTVTSPPASIYTQLGGKITAGTGINSLFARRIGESSDGNTLIVGAPGHNNSMGGLWVYTYSGGNFILIQTFTGSGAIGPSQQGYTVKLSGDGNTALIAGIGDNSNMGAAWVYTFNGTYFVELVKLTASDASANAFFGRSLAISADGKMILVGGPLDAANQGAFWFYKYNGSNYIQVGSKFIPSDAPGFAQVGFHLALTPDGQTAVIGGPANGGASWVYTFNGTTFAQVGNKLMASDATLNSNQGNGVSIAADGKTIFVGGPGDNNQEGGFWVYSFNGTGYIQATSKIVGVGAQGNAQQGSSIRSTSDGSMIFLVGVADNGGQGATWVFTSSGNSFQQVGSKIVATGTIQTTIGGINQGGGSSSDDGSIMFVGARGDNDNRGALFVFKRNTTPQTIIGLNSIPTQTLGDDPYTITGVSGGGSGNPVVITSSNSSIVSVSGNVLTALSSGVVTITANQAGNGSYSAATPVMQVLTVIPFIITPISVLRNAIDINGLPTITGRVNIAGQVYGTNNVISALGISLTIIDATGGIALFNSPPSIPYIREGDLVTISGFLANYNGLMQISSITNLITGLGGNLRNPPALKTVLNESTESDFITVIADIDTTQWLGNGVSFNVNITVGGVQYLMRIWGPSELSTQKATKVFSGKNTNITMAGLGGQFCGSSPYTCGYQISPYLLSDIKAKFDQTITGFNPISSQPLNNATYTIPGVTASSGLPVTFTSSNLSVATVSGNIVSFLSVGVITITASQTGNSTYDAANPVSQVLTITNNTITPIVDLIGQDASLNLTNVGINTIRGQIVSNNLGASAGISGGFHASLVDATGSITLRIPASVYTVSGVALQEGMQVTVTGQYMWDALYTQVGQFQGWKQFHVTSINAFDPSILPRPQPKDVTVLNELSEDALVRAVTVIDSATWNNYASISISISGIPYTMRIYSATPLYGTKFTTLFGNGERFKTVTVTGIGSQADVSAPYDANYRLDPYLVSDLAFDKTLQSITGFATLPPKIINDAPFSISGITATSGLPVSFSGSNASVALVSPLGDITITGAGTVTITAYQLGNSFYNSASVSQVLNVNKLPQSITGFSIPPALTVNGVYTITNVFGGASGNPIVYTASNPSLVSIAGNILQALSVGTVTITASQLGNATSSDALDVSQTLTIVPIAKINQSINGSPVPVLTVGGIYQLKGFTGGSSGNPILFNVTDTTKINSLGNLLLPLLPGLDTLVVSQAGNGSYDDAIPLRIPITITGGLQVKKSQSITILPNPVIIGVGQQVILNVFAESGLPVSLTTSGIGISVSGFIIYGLITGSATVIANQAGNEEYLPAASVTVSVLVTAPGMLSTLSGILGKTTVVPNMSTNFTEINQLPGYTYIWKYNGGPVSINNDSSSNVNIYFPSNAASGNLYCYIYDDKKNLVDFSVQEITVNPDPVAALATQLVASKCEPVITDCRGHYIDNFTIGKLDNLQSGCSTGGFGDFTASGKLDSLLMGSTYEAKISSAGTKEESYFGIWIDYNNNGSFDDGGEFAGSSYNADTAFTVPSLLIRNDPGFLGPRRLRIKMTSSKIDANQSCLENGTSGGETEDYLIYLKQAARLEGPDLFTPNNDGKNDLFIIKGIDPKKSNNLIIVDRWGEKKFERANYQNDWDGKEVHGSPLTRGTYFYFFTNGPDSIQGFFEVFDK